MHLPPGTGTASCIFDGVAAHGLVIGGRKPAGNGPDDQGAPVSGWGLGLKLPAFLECLIAPVSSPCCNRSAGAVRSLFWASVRVDHGIQAPRSMSLAWLILAAR